MNLNGLISHSDLAIQESQLKNKDGCLTLAVETMGRLMETAWVLLSWRVEAQLNSEVVMDPFPAWFSLFILVTAFKL